MLVFAARSAVAQLPPESMLTAATTSVAGNDGQAWTYLSWSAGTSEALRGRSFRLYAKRGDPAAAAAFAPVAELVPVSGSAAAIAPLLARATELGDVPGELAATLDAVTGSPVVRAAPSPDAKLAVALQLATSQPPVEAALQWLATRFHAVRFALGRAWAGRLPTGTTTLEVREIDALTRQESRVVARLTLEVGTPSPLPAASPLQVIPPRSTADDLRVALVWGEPESLRHRRPLLAGFDVWRISAARARELGWDARAPALVDLRASAERINEQPVALTRHLTPAEAAATEDPDGALVTDRGPRAPAWRDGDEFAWFVVARDLLGHGGEVSAAVFGFVCARQPPPAPRDLALANGFTTAGVTADRRPTVALRWSAPASDFAGVTRFEIFRGATNLPAVVSTNESTLKGQVAELAYDRAVERYDWIDSSFDPHLDPGLWGQGFWYAIRTVREGACGPVRSPLSPAVFINLRRYDAPASPTGELGVNCPRVVLQRAQEAYRNEQLEGPALAERHYRLLIRRRDQGVAWVEATVDRGLPDAAPILSPQLRFGEEDGSVAFDFTVARTAAEMRPPIVDLVAGAYSGAVSEPLRFELPSDPGVATRLIALADAATVSIAEANPADPFAAGLFTGPYLLSDVRLTSNDMRVAGSPTSAGQILVEAAPPGTPPEGEWRFVTLTRPFTLVRGQGPVLIFGDPQVPADAHLPDAVRYRAWIVSPPRAGSDAGCPHVARPAGSNHVQPVVAGLALPPRARAWRIFRQVDDAPSTLIAEGLGDPGSWIEARDDAMPDGAARLCYFGQVADENGNWSPLGPLGCVEVVPAGMLVPLLAAPEAEGDTTAPVMRLQWFCVPTGVRAFQVILKPISGKPPAQGKSDATSILKTLVVEHARPVAWYAKSALTTESVGSVVPSALRTGPVGLEPRATALGEGPDFTFPVDVEVNQTYEVQVAAVDARGNLGPASHLHRFTWKVPRLPVDREVPWPQRPLPPVQALHRGISAVLLATNLVIWPGSSNTYPVGVRIGSLAIGQRELIDDLFGLGDGEYGGRLLRLFATRLLVATGRGLETVFFGDEVSSTPRPDFHATNVVLYRQQVSNDEFPEVSGDVVQVSPRFRRLAVRALADGSGFELLDPMIGLTLNLPIPNAAVGGTSPPRLDFHLLDLHPVVQGARYRYWIVHFDARGEPDQTIPAGEVEVPL